ncbi:Nucleoporin nup84 [Coemansia sp. BCRC 34490]|nr:Nucleoporin nup84 [Coemansia sp. BCRC 34490]
MAPESDVIRAFAGVVENQQAHSQGEGGNSRKSSASTARLFAQLAKEHYAQFAESDSFSMSPYGKKNGTRQWLAESSTWNLLGRLYSLRLQSSSSDNGKEDTVMDGDLGTDMEMDAGTAKDISTVEDTDFTRVQDLMDADPLLSEYVEVRRWLEENAPAFHPVETRKGYLFYTRKSIRDRKTHAGTASQQPEKTDNTVTEADPDAPSRQRKELAYEDAEYEASLLRTLFEYVRRGRVGDAMDLCAESDEPWRAASMKGGLLWRDPSLEPEIEDDMPVNVENGACAVDRKPSHTAGNINRMLWKQTCAALAHDENNEMYERALYAALGGRLDEVLLVCETWEDYLWAYINTMVEAKIDSGISDANSLYTPAQTTSLNHIQSKYPPIRDMTQIFASLTEIDSTVLQKSAQEPFQSVQRSIINNDFASYIDSYARRLRAGEMDDAERDILRFVVHAALYLSELGVELPAEAVETNLQAYIAILSTSHPELVAAYVMHLPTKDQTDSYSLFLYGINDSISVRLDLLRLAEQHGLDTDAICKRTTQLVLDASKTEDNPDVFCDSRESFALAEPVEPITDIESEQIRAIEWVTSSAQLYDHALVGICKLVRWFLLHGRTNAATQLFNSLPDDFVQQDWIKGAESGEASDPIVSHFQEYIHLLSLCDAYAYYATWSELLYKRPVESRVHGSRYQALWLEWKESITAATDRASQMFRNRILDVDWLGSPLGLGGAAADDMDTSGDDAPLRERMQEIERLRELYIPETVFRLHSILFETRDALPKNLKRSLGLAQLVADESLGIYHQLAKPSLAHPQGRLISFMNLMRRSAFEIMRVQQESQPNKPPLIMDPAIISSGAV